MLAEGFSARNDTLQGRDADNNKIKNYLSLFAVDLTWSRSLLLACRVFTFVWQKCLASLLNERSWSSHGLRSLRRHSMCL